MLIWGTPVSALQFFGYSIALSGLVYYKLGADKIREYFGQAGRSWQEFGVQRPALRKLVILGFVIVTLVLLMGGFGNTVITPEPAKAPLSTVEKLKEWVGGAGSGTGGR